MYNLQYIKEALKKIDCSVAENEPMSRHTTFKIGGNAELFVSVNTIEALKEVIDLCRLNDVPYIVIGNGSNLLVSDKGIKGVVITLAGSFKEIYLEDENTIYCGAGASLASLCAFACRSGLSGLEFAWGIPGNTGGAVFMNAGAYGGEMKDVIICSQHLDREGNKGEFSGEQGKYSYRHSIYADNGYIITGIKVKLTPCDKNIITERMNDLMDRRRQKQPLEYPSAGSTFKRPEGYFAAALIEQCGLKGCSVGGAEVSTKHCGFIINKDGATCKDVLDLVDVVRRTVKEKTGVNLECEIRPIGE